jgi:hypothetical protein
MKVLVTLTVFGRFLPIRASVDALPALLMAATARSVTTWRRDGWPPSRDPDVIAFVDALIANPSPTQPSHVHRTIDSLVHEL